jgi:NhaP-type Na+/H+ or K+/H+ antiporter
VAAAGSNIILLVAGIIALGVGGQLLADRFKLPSIIFYLAVGLTLGPGTGIITRSTFTQDALAAIVGLAVAIIVFEGAFHLKLERVREAPSAALRLVTLGAVGALLGTAAAVHVFLGVEWGLSFLVGALLVATGPTVITPILTVVPVRDRVAAALETEGIVNDVSAAILAVVVFEALLLDEEGGGEFVSEFARRVGQGLLVGIVVAAAVYYLIRYVDLSPGNAPRNARLLVLASALVAFAGANELASEAGVASVATAGILLGNFDLPYEEEIEAFKGDITLLVLSFVFIALAAQVRPSDLLGLGLGGALVVAAVMLVIRPVLVFASTLGDRFTTNERVFMSFVGPRGIIPASVATLFAVRLRSQAADLEAAGQAAEAAAVGAQADVLVGTVFLVILVTVVVEGGLAHYLGAYLDVIPMRVIIVGGGKAGRALAERLEDRGENVVIVEAEEDIVETTRNEGFTVEWGDGTDTEVLRSAGAGRAKIVVAATGDDDANLLVSQLAASKFDVEQVIARANNPDNVDAFEDLGVRTISGAMATAWAMDNQIERPAMARWMTKVGRTGDVQEIELSGGDLVGKAVREVGPMLPDECLIALVSRDGETRVPGADFVLEKGDRVTLIGQRDAVREGMEMCAMKG